MDRDQPVSNRFATAKKYGQKVTFEGLWFGYLLILNEEKKSEGTTERKDVQKTYNKKYFQTTTGADVQYIKINVFGLIFKWFFQSKNI